MFKMQQLVPRVWLYLLWVDALPRFPLKYRNAEELLKGDLLSTPQLGWCCQRSRQAAVSRINVHHGWWELIAVQMAGNNAKLSETQVTAEKKAAGKCSSSAPWPQTQLWVICCVQLACPNWYCMTPVVWLPPSLFIQHRYQKTKDTNTCCLGPEAEQLNLITQVDDFLFCEWRSISWIFRGPKVFRITTKQWIFLMC